MVRDLTKAHKVFGFDLVHHLNVKEGDRHNVN